MINPDSLNNYMKIKQPRYKKNIPVDIAINPEEYYSVAKASCYLGKSRMSIYRYLASHSHALDSRKRPGCFKTLIKGEDLIAFKAKGLPKCGRHRLDHFDT